MTVFLDFDGPLLTGRMIQKMSGELSTDYEERFAQMADPEAIESLTRLVLELDADVVISSTHRMGKTVKDLRFLLKESGLPVISNRVVGKTPVINILPRGNEIRAWMEIHDVLPEEILIIDDNDDMLYLSHRLVQVDFETGFTEDKRKEAVRLANNQ